MTRTERRNLRNGLLFASPYLAGMFVLSFYPFAATLYLSFTQYNVVSPPVWVGTENYRTIFFEDPLFWKSMWNTIYFTLLSVPLGLALSIGLAVLLHRQSFGRSVFRTVFFLPTIVPLVASSVLWLWILNPDLGLLNEALGAIGIDSPPGWLADPFWSKPSFVILSMWTVGTAVVIFLAGLGEVPASLYESAKIDGAGRLQQFRHVTLPMLTPTILFNLVMGLINAFQYFTQVYVMTLGTGRPADSTLFYALYLYRNAFSYLRMGYGSALAWILFMIILCATLGILASSRRWVYYHGES